MSQPLPGYPAPPRRRKGVKGVAITGAICVALAVVAMIGTMVFLVMGLFSTDAEVPVDGQPHNVSLDGDAERMIFVEDGSDARCTVRDADGDEIPLDGVGGEVTRSVNGEDREGVSTFEPDGGSVEVTCTGSAGQLDAQVGESPFTGTRITMIAVGFGISAILGVTGVVLLVVALVRKVSRPA